MALLWPMLKCVLVLMDQKVPPVLFLEQLDLDLVECRGHQYQQLVGGDLALKYSLLGAWNLLPATYLEFITIIPLANNSLLGFLLLLHLNKHPILGFLSLQ